LTKTFTPRLGFEPSSVKAPAAKDLADNMKANIEHAKSMLECTRERMKLQADKHRLAAPTYQIGDLVWLSAKHLTLDKCPSRKLTERWIGPYQVISVHTNSVGLLFSKSVKARHMVNVSRVKPYIEPLPGQPIVHPGPMSVNDEGTSEFEVDYIVDLVADFSTWCTGKDTIHLIILGNQPPVSKMHRQWSTTSTAENLWLLIA
jgi:hypothetical protein